MTRKVEYQLHYLQKCDGLEKVVRWACWVEMMKVRGLRTKPWGTPQEQIYCAVHGHFESIHGYM